VSLWVLSSFPQFLASPARRKAIFRNFPHAGRRGSMSTAGKVLVVLFLLVLPVWIILVSAVASLNTEWTQVLAKLEKQVVDLEPQVVANQAKILQLQDQITLAQKSAADEQTLLRARIAEVERAKAEVVQIRTAVANQVDLLHSAVQAAQNASSKRKDERDSETAAKAAAIASVNKLDDENTKLLDELLNLRKEFKQLLEQNRQLVSSASPSTRRATSFAR